MFYANKKYPEFTNLGIPTINQLLINALIYSKVHRFSYSF